MAPSWPWVALLVGSLLAAGCRDRAALTPGPLRGRAERLVAEQRGRDLDLEQCRSRMAQAEAEPAEEGARAFDAARVALLGRVRGTPVIFVREPRATHDGELSPRLRATRAAGRALPARARVRQVLARHLGDYAGLRALLLREGYLYASDPEEALALVEALELSRLFAEPELWLQRGAETHRLVRAARRGGAEYHFADGAHAGEPAHLLWGDRVSSAPGDLAVPLHRDPRPLAWSTGVDRIRPLHQSRTALVAELRLGTRWVRALVSAVGARLALGCLDAPRAVREEVAAWQQAEQPRRRALAALRQSIDALVTEKPPFDRPRGAPDHLTDGQLRPQWWSAYRRGQLGFTHEDEGYLVFDAAGRPLPPQMCVDFVLDGFERAAGTWFRPLGEPRERIVGGLDFTALGVENRAGVLAFGQFAAAHPELFEFAAFAEEERIPFGERARFFAFLADRADRFRPADVVAIEGLKRDGNIHQHAILIEDTDPVTGFPYGLADQMKWPRRRTWEGIMAEAPRRSLLFQLRLRPALLLRLGGSPDRG